MTRGHRICLRVLKQIAQVVQSESTRSLEEALNFRSVLVFMKEASGGAGAEWQLDILLGNLVIIRIQWFFIFRKFLMLRSEEGIFWPVHIHLVALIAVLCIDSLVIKCN